VLCTRIDCAILLHVIIFIIEVVPWNMGKQRRCLKCHSILQSLWNVEHSSQRHCSSVLESILKLPYCQLFVINQLLNDAMRWIKRCGKHLREYYTINSFKHICWLWKGPIELLNLRNTDTFWRRTGCNPPRPMRFAVLMTMCASTSGFGRFSSVISYKQLASGSEELSRFGGALTSSKAKTEWNRIQRRRDALYQWSPNCGPRAACGPQQDFVRPAEWFWILE